MTRDIEQLIAAEHWKEARSLIKLKLRSKPNDHWLLSRLALTYYEERKYSWALRYDLKALAAAPYCPLSLWGYAGGLEMLAREREAIEIYRRLIKRGVESIAFGACGEGLAWARGLVADSYYRLAHCYQSLGKKALAFKYLNEHVSLRGPGCRSIYHLGKVRKEIEALKQSRFAG